MGEEMKIELKLLYRYIIKGLEVYIFTKKLSLPFKIRIGLI
jgi:hypothetical protein